MDQKQKENITYGIRKLAHLFRAIQAVDNGAAAGGIRVIYSVSQVMEFLFVESFFLKIFGQKGTDSKEIMVFFSIHSRSVNLPPLFLF